MSAEIFEGLSAFPLTPADENGIDYSSYERILERLVNASVDTIGVLGTTGNYAYFNKLERIEIIKKAISIVGKIPVIAGIGALRTTDILRNAELAQEAGASAVLFSPMSYQSLTEAEVLSLYTDIAGELSVPLCLYDNPLTTKFTFTDDLYQEIAQLPQVKAVKVPAVPTHVEGARARAEALRNKLPKDVNIGVSGDASAAAGLNGGFDVWFSVLGGIAPKICLQLDDAARDGDSDTAQRISQQLQPIWDLNAQYGSLRVTSAIAAELELTQRINLPRPLLEVPPSAWPAIRCAADLIRAEDPVE